MGIVKIRADGNIIYFQTDWRLYTQWFKSYVHRLFPVDWLADKILLVFKVLKLLTVSPVNNIRLLQCIKEVIALLVLYQKSCMWLVFSNLSLKSFFKSYIFGKHTLS